MTNQHIHQKLQQASQIIQEAVQTYMEAQGQDPQLMQQTLDQLKQAENQLESVQQEGGKEATDNPQFQQAYEQLHDMRERIELTSDHKDDLF